MAKVKAKKINLGDNSDLSPMFNVMVGLSDPDPQIVIPKYKKILTKATNMLKLFESLLRTNMPFYKFFFEYNMQGFMDIQTFVSQGFIELEKYKLEEVNHVLSAKELTEMNSNPDKIKEYLEASNTKAKIDNLQERWRNLKDCSTIQNYILIARNLKTLLHAEKLRSKETTHNLENDTQLSLNFIKHCDGDYLRIFEFSSLDFKQIVLSGFMTPDLERYLAMFLYLLYKDTISIVETISMPDINIEEFSQVLISKISECKKHIPRCDLAFKKITESVEMLKGRFPDYYKDFVTSQSNPGIIIESFVRDVAEQSNHDPELVRQFRTIMTFIQQRMSSVKVKDPRAEKIFSMLNKNMDILDKKQPPPQ